MKRRLLDGLVRFAESEIMPDFVARLSIRRLLRKRLESIVEGSPDDVMKRNLELASTLFSGPLAVRTDAANEQHYELPPAYFELALGSRRKYSSCFFETPSATLDEAEEVALRQTAEHAEIADGMQILELGCGWGSLSLWMAEHFKRSEIIGISNSTSQRVYLESEIKRRALTNVRIVTADINTFDPARKFDRIVSVEMFEHVRNHAVLLERVAGWLVPDGKLMTHVFCHRSAAYVFEDREPSDWMARHFFTGGMMPDSGWLVRASRGLSHEQHWEWSGTHYQRTADAWLSRHDAHRDQILGIFRSVYGDRNAKLWFQRWRLFYLACSELFGFRGGSEWLVVHDLFQRRG